MLSKSQIKFICSLHQKKYREQSGMFIAEGIKIVKELLAGDFEIVSVYSTDSLLAQEYEPYFQPIEIISETELKKISTLKTPNKILALAKIKEEKNTENTSELCLVYDGIKDPGNMGTIIRIGDWFGAKAIYCSHDSVDCYNPKVIQASMGSIFRLQPTYIDLKQLISSLNSENIFLADMDGESLYDTTLPTGSTIIFGSESHGISEEIKQLVPNKITIPRFGDAESLNVSVASGIICSEYRKKG
jgi:RNA methyltransferase, TrmH family